MPFKKHFRFISNESKKVPVVSEKVNKTKRIDPLRQEFPNSGVMRGRNVLGANEIVDTVLKCFHQYVVDHNLSEVSIPDQHLKQKLLPKCVAKVDIRNGTVKNLATLRRSSGFTIQRNPSSHEVKADGCLIFEELSAKFTYSMKLGHIGPTGHVGVTVGRNAVDLTIWGHLKNHSKFNIRKVFIKIQLLSDFNISISGLGAPLNWVAEQITNVIIDKMNSKILRAIETAVIEAIDAKLKEKKNVIHVKM